MIKPIRTRYAPSPTGYLHIGGARTALFSYLFAKHHNGKFIFRLEDTDFTRNVEGGEKSQLDNLKWLGIIPDESPEDPNKKFGQYRQSEKLDIYNSYIEKMLNNKTAYKAFDTTNELLLQKEEQEKNGQYSFRYDRNWLKISPEDKEKRENSGEFVIRVSLPKNKEYEWNDLVRGKINFNSDEIGDWVIRKSDGHPTYNFAVVIDDHEMEITHVLRGEEHIANTPKQLAIYEIFNWIKPEFGHLTIITNTEGKKLSKRDTSLNQFIEDYKVQGYCPEAIFNFLALLGWTNENSVELMSKEELIKSFDYKRLSKSPSKFDIQKMDWFAKKYMKNQCNEILKKKLLFSKNQDENWKDIFLNTYKENSKNILELQSNIEKYEVEKIVGNYLPNEVTDTFKEILLSLEFNINNIQSAIDKTKLKCNVSGKNLFTPIRQMTTGLDYGPELAKAIFLFGESKIKSRLKNDN